MKLKDIAYSKFAINEIENASGQFFKRDKTKEPVYKRSAST
jgi:hypothetical protein